MILRKIIVYLFFIVVFTFGYKVVTARAASLYFSPSSKNVTVGNIVEIGVYVNTGDQAINNVEGGIVYPTDLLEVLSTSKSGSIFSLWVEEPSFSNSSGRISFNGGVPTPGYKGSSGRVINIVFRAKSKGEATLYFTSSAVRANDGLGTNILSGSGSANIGIKVVANQPADNENIKIPPAIIEPPVSGGSPAAPLISSDTHPNSDSWYSNNKPLFNWKIASGIKAIQLLVGLKQNVMPTVTYAPAISSRQLEVLEDGIWYFHVRLKNSNGWGNVTHFRFQIDTKKPDAFVMKLLEDESINSPIKKFNFESNDQLSGISHYEIQIDSGEVQQWIDDGSHVYSTPTLTPGHHILVAKAVDKAGNYLSNFSDFDISALESPLIIDYPKELQKNDIFVAKGKSYPNSQVVVWWQRDSETPQRNIVKVDADGNFSFAAGQRLSEGVYKLWAEVIDQSGARSNFSQKLIIVVRPLQIVRFGNLTISVLSVIIPSLALILSLIFGLIFSRRRWSILRGRVRREVGEAESVLHREFSNLRKKMKVHIKALEQISKKRKLSKEEQLTISHLREDLESAERNVEKEIEDIRKEVK